MEEENCKSIHKKNGVTNGLCKEIPSNFSWHENITTIDLSARNIDTFGENVQLPPVLMELNLSRNKFVEVPAVVLKKSSLKTLDLSHNAIEYFDETPSFCHTLEHLDLSTNNLLGPPYWIWTETPKRLLRVNLSCNTNITQSLVNGYLEELLLYKTLILEVDLHNCGIGNKNLELLATFKNAKSILFGIAEYNYHGANIVCEVPSKGLEKCSDVERLNLSNTSIHTVNNTIDILKNLCEINLACNNLSGLPNEFCNLANLESCVLSNNRILYLPEDMFKLKKLVRFCVDSNKLCMVPEKLLELPNLKVLDLYDNHLSEFLQDYSHLQEFDLSQNFLDEPDNVDYLEKKEKLRLLHENRYDGRKPEVIQPESEHTSEESDNEDYYRKLYNGEIPEDELTKPEKDHSERSSSPEDWDSDAHWIPHDVRFPAPSQAWIHFIKRKMSEGNFCPIDIHVVPITEQVMYKKKLNPEVDVECVGQFDDYSSDDS